MCRGVGSHATVHSATILNERVVGLNSLGSLGFGPVKASAYVSWSSLNAWGQQQQQHTHTH